MKKIMLGMFLCAAVCANAQSKEESASSVMITDHDTTNNEIVISLITKSLTTFKSETVTIAAKSDLQYLHVAKNNPELFVIKYHKKIGSIYPVIEQITVLEKSKKTGKLLPRIVVLIPTS